MSEKQLVWLGILSSGVPPWTIMLSKCHFHQWHLMEFSILHPHIWSHLTWQRPKKGMLADAADNAKFLTNLAALLCQATRWQHPTTHALLQNHPFFSSTQWFCCSGPLSYWINAFPSFLETSTVLYQTDIYSLFFSCVVQGNWNHTMKCNRKVVKLSSQYMLYLIPNIAKL